MPHLLISQSSTGPPQASLPLAAFQAPIRILKRAPPSPSAGSGGSNTPSTTKQSLAEREARYQAARDRIFADGESGKAETQEKSGGRAGESITVVRNPRGPAPLADEGS